MVAARHFLSACCQVSLYAISKCDGHAVGFEYIGDIVDKRLRLSGMDKADGRCVSGGENRRFGNAVEACRGGTQTEIGRSLLSQSVAS